MGGCDGQYRGACLPRIYLSWWYKHDLIRYSRENHASKVIDFMKMIEETKSILCIYVFLNSVTKNSLTIYYILLYFILLCHVMLCYVMLCYIRTYVRTTNILLWCIFVYVRTYVGNQSTVLTYLHLYMYGNCFARNR